jgi:nucleotide-binding universal stress UspA family protein
MIKTILVAIDGSKLAEQVLPVITALAAQTSAEIILATAMVPRDAWTKSPVAQEWEQEEQGAASAYLKLVQEQLLDRGIKVRGVRVVWGRPHVVINAIADEEDADLIAMTTHGRAGFARWVTGSVGDKVLRTSRRPILLIHSRDEAETADMPQVHIERILVPLDGSPLGESVLPFVRELAASVNASLVVLKVVVPTPELSASFLPGSTSILEGLQVDAEKYIGGVAKRLKQAGVTVKTALPLVKRPRQFSIRQGARALIS